MSTDSENPNDPTHRIDVLEANREVFETIRDSGDLPPRFREKYGQRPLDALERLQAEVAEE